jgi:NADPH-dependent curcumin reductase CurA
MMGDQGFTLARRKRVMTQALKGKRWLLADRPATRAVKESDFRLDVSDVPQPGDGEVLLRTLFLSLDPYMRGRMVLSKSYAAPVEIGQVMTGEVVAEVIASHAPQIPVGTIVKAPSGWQEYAVLPAAQAEPVEADDLPLSYHLGVLGMPGETAYFALSEIGRPKEGETVLISAAAGAVGQVAGQIAKLKGCRVIGTAGSDDKLAFVRDELGFDEAVNYKGKDAETLGAELAALAPQGIDVFFDNVGGVTHDAVMANLALFARIIICGVIAAYDKPGQPDVGLRWNRQLLVKRALMQGFLVWDHRERKAEFRRAMTGWLKSGALRYREDIVDGIDAAPGAFIGLLAGANRGKLLVRVAKDA